MRKYLCLFITLLPLFLLTGCKDQVEIEDRDFIQTLMVSKENNNFKLYYGLPDLAASTGQNVTESKQAIREFQASSIFIIEDEYNMDSEKRLDYTHLKAIILDEAISADPEKMTSFLSYLQDNYEISRNTPVYITYDKMDAISKLNEKISGGIGSSLELLFKNTKGRTSRLVVTVSDCINAYTVKDKTLLVPVITIKDDALSLKGAAIFYQDGIKKSLPEHDYRLLLTALGKSENNIIYLNESLSFQVESVSTRLSFSKDSFGMPAATLYFTGILNKRNNAYYADTEINQWLELQISEVLSDCYRLKLDVLNLYRVTALNDKSLWSSYQENHLGFLDEISLKIKSDFKVR